MSKGNVNGLLEPSIKRGRNHNLNPIIRIKFITNLTCNDLMIMRAHHKESMYERKLYRST